MQAINIETILACEHEYACVISNFEVLSDRIRYTTPALLDYYSGNYTLILDLNKLDEIIKEELKLRNKLSFCKILYYAPSVHAETTAQVSQNIIMAVNNFDHLQFNSNPNCEVVRLTTQEQLDAFKQMELHSYGTKWGAEFVCNKIDLFASKYIGDSTLNNYVCIHKGEVVGAAELFITNRIAKIENVSVSIVHRKQNYASTLLAHVVNVAKQQGCQVIYLVADKDDTVQDMYRKQGFKDIFVFTELFFNNL